MVEAGANEIPEAEILDALDIAHGEIKKLCALQRELREKAGKPKHRDRGARRSTTSCYSQIKADRTGADARRGDARWRTSSSARTRPRRSRSEVLEQYAGRRPTPTTYAERRADAQLAFDELEKEIIRERIAVQKKRPDGRSASEIRPITIEVEPLPRTHGSALFTRGQTQALSVVALGHARARRCAWTPSGSRRRSATSTTTTSRPSRWARPASCAAPSAATSATARSPSARSCR